MKKLTTLLLVIVMIFSTTLVGYAQAWGNGISVTMNTELYANPGQSITLEGVIHNTNSSGKDVYIKVAKGKEYLNNFSQNLWVLANGSMPFTGTVEAPNKAGKYNIELEFYSSKNCAVLYYKSSINLHVKTSGSSSSSSSSNTVPCGRGSKPGSMCTVPGTIRGGRVAANGGSNSNSNRPHSNIVSGYTPRGTHTSTSGSSYQGTNPNCPVHGINSGKLGHSTSGRYSHGHHVLLPIRMSNCTCD